MKKNILKSVAIITFVMSISFNACKKTNQMTILPGNGTRVQSSHLNPLSVSTNIVNPSGFSACGKLINVFTPSDEIYKMGMVDGTSYRAFGIPEVGFLNFENIDHITFEFSGLYADLNNTVKLYYIKRTDGKYLTNVIEVGFVSKFEGSGAPYQLWIISSLGSNRYKLVLPRTSQCRLLRTYPASPLSKYDFKIGVVPSDETNYIGTTTIFIISALEKLPVTQ